jgi:virulence-associated protein VagC
VVPIYAAYIDGMTKVPRAKIFWSGGSQAVRLPKALRLPGAEVLVHRRAGALVLEPVPEGDDWAGFWDRLLPLKDPVKRHPTRSAEKRRPL